MFLGGEEQRVWILFSQKGFPMASSLLSPFLLLSTHQIMRWSLRPSQGHQDIFLKVAKICENAVIALQ